MYHYFLFFIHSILQVPNEVERREILNCLLRNTPLASDVSVPILAIQTAALVASDLVDLCDRAMAVSVERATCHHMCGQKILQSPHCWLTFFSEILWKHIRFKQAFLLRRLTSTLLLAKLELLTLKV